MNIVMLIGRLTRDPEIKEAPTTKVASYTLAVERRKKAENGENEADFINCKAFGKSADFAQNWLHKGTKIALRGHIQTGKYTNKDGVTVYTTDVIVDDQEFAESKAAAEQSSVQTGKSAKTDNFLDIIPDTLQDEGLPFK